MKKLSTLCTIIVLATTTNADDSGMVPIDGTFFIDIYEFPNQHGSLPKVDVTWRQAETLCAEQDKRLCTEQEWQKACTGPHNYTYSYGEKFEPKRCNTPFDKDGLWQRGSGLVPSGSFKNCANEYGVHDMIGNAWEWTASWYSRPKLWRVVRGGSFFHSANLARANTRYGFHLDPEYHLDLVGFRCCRSILTSKTSK